MIYKLPNLFFLKIQEILPILLIIQHLHLVVQLVLHEFFSVVGTYGVVSVSKSVKRSSRSTKLSASEESDEESDCKSLLMNSDWLNTIGPFINTIKPPKTLINQKLPLNKTPIKQNLSNIIPQNSNKPKLQSTKTPPTHQKISLLREKKNM